MRKLKKIIKNAGQATADAKAAGLDGVYLHGHEGYLLEQLTNPAFNRRKMGRYADWQRFGIEAWHWVCPLTQLEHRSRVAAGQQGLAPTGFIDTYIQDVMYPAALNGQVLLLVACLVVASWVGFVVLAVRRRRRRARLRAGVGPRECR